ncbi:unnamed protein product [Alternaria alternata]
MLDGKLFLAPIGPNPQPTFTAPNVKFELDDVQLEWTYQPNSFDYIHVRCMLGAIQDWAHLYREIYK